MGNTSTGKGFILLVEDDPGVQELQAQRLETLDLEIKRAATAEETLATLRSARPELMLLDYSLPGMTALELLERLRREETGVPPFMLVTGRGDERVAVDAMKAGALDYIVKDASFLDNLLPAVRKALEKSDLKRKLERTEADLRKSLRLYNFLAGVNHAAAREKDRNRLLQEICAVAVRAGARMAWAGEYDSDIDRVVPLCSAGFVDGYLDKIKITREGPESKGPTGKALNTGEITLCSDIASDQTMLPWRDRALQRGYLSSAGIPVYEGGKLRLILTLYSGEKDFFSAAEMAMLSEVQADLTLALEAILSEERRAASQAALERTATELAHMMETNPVALFRMRLKEGHFLIDWVSGNVRGLLGYDESEILVPGWFKTVVHPEDRLTPEQREAILPGGFGTHDFRVKRKDGRYIWIHAQLKPLGNGEVLGAWSDITQLKESEERFQEMFEKAPVGYQSLDAQGNILAVNRTWCRVFDRAQQEVIGRNFGDFLIPGSRAVFTEKFPRFKAAGAVEGVEFDIARPDGQTRRLSFSGRIGHNKDGSFRQTHCVFTDITETWKARAQADLLSRAIRESYNEVYVFDAASFKFIFVNRGAIKNLGYAPEEMEELTPWDIKPEFTEASFKKTVAPLFSGEKEVLLLESAHRRKDGSTYPVEIRLQLVRDAAMPVFLAVINDITERKRTNEALENQRRLFSDMLANSSAAIFATDLDGRFLIANKELCRIMKVPADQLIGSTREGKLLPEFVREHLANDRKIIETGRAMIFEEHTQVDGVARNYSASKFPLRDNTGKIYGICGILNDVTDRRQAEELVKEKERQYRELFDNMQDAVALHELIYDASGKPSDYRFISVNPAFERIMAITAEAAAGRTVKELIPGLNPFWIKTYADVVASGRPADFCRHDEQLGRTFHVVAIPAGQRRFAAFIQDITERERAREELAQSERRFQTLVDASPEGVMVRTGKKVIYINNSGLKILRASDEREVLGHSILEKLPGKYHKAVEERMAEVDTRGVPTQPMEIEYVAMDGSMLDLEISGSPIIFMGEKCGVVFFRDVSGKKKAERMVQELAAMQRVESLGQLAGGIAHDFNNMLTGIMANISLMERRCGHDREGADILRETMEAARNAQSLTSSLLAFSKGGQPIKKEICLGTALSDIFKLATRGASAASELDVAGDLWSVEGDENQLKQAINNLLINGLQAMPAGGTLRLKAENLPEGSPLPDILKDGKYVRIRVSDSGIGIPKEYQDRIFEPYFTTKERGHGLGLPMTWSVVKNHGGHISVASVPGQGTDFEIHLPSTGRRPPDASRAGKEIVKGSGRILVLEDEEVIIHALRRMLKELRYDCEFVTDGKEAVRRYLEEKAAGKPFTAVIMDLTIPGGMGGRAAVLALRERAPEAKVIVSSGYSEDGAMADYKDNGFDAMLPKPYKFEELAEVLAALVGKDAK